ncbi:MAG: phosphoribosylamine--glycine ligase, partial [Congregibacter sp.]|nr:phosphoribosylamine--glycine ligase [Congregibacter sp.]
MNILVVGSGGREHALAWKLAEPETVQRVYVAPGNAGTALEPKLENIALDPMDIEGLAQFAKDRDCALTVIGPEAPLVAGIVDHFAEQG